ncbi:hydroxymethylglutaryl-CoA lyase [Flavisolibacter ginsengisoli]|jgi:hydroxymethylglutaryl-CoA lyase|uniref:Hydroxymethylglutaryl-CoA lyase n=1 Tax=Flavisolibacter ginsengisoli DSM 18119 TaxID=1121884 RepID=A0A1M4XF18_9BACT|nr:hydroxymethylglutaryl-CoA lyase [Flavisolibacter ginsengisoli]SHE92115.1 hydroxymethylglutaryl-CoA lyase [Flavisolibacter ginsengisoli DSM 18119]
MTSAKNIQLVECPRDAMQGWKHFIPTEQKVEYINSLLQVGFHTIDFGSFVSPKAIPQMADTADVLKKLHYADSGSALLSIVANLRGAEEAVSYNEISYLGFPFSLSPTFQLRNTNSTMEESVKRVEEIQNLCVNHNKKLVVYLSMGFGNPYGDAYTQEVLLLWADEMVQRGITILSLADTVGLATPAQISFALNTLIPKYPDTTIGVHLHSTPFNWKEKLEAAVNAGCTRIDGALKGIGGCPMAQDDLVGNMNMEWIIGYLQEQGLVKNINEAALEKCLDMSSRIFV